ncbi:Hypothetical protein NTJ_14042 [Nesidiocoris tenuis]|uniref:Uncharacterized protein n=1 Tax=Nesidiocoris tenuis TaxID=355587 RepID=A0ABN7BA16_9HEMI|nr:Hypothetical protein NTJ_14042 [Nesidiocoris tenuis]
MGRSAMSDRQRRAKLGRQWCVRVAELSTGGRLGCATAPGRLSAARSTWRTRLFYLTDCPTCNQMLLVFSSRPPPPPFVRLAARESRVALVGHVSEYV